MTSLALAAPLPHRGVIRVIGADRLTFLQGVISNDTKRLQENIAIYAALLTPQGKFLHDLFIHSYDDSLLIDCEASRADDLIQRLTNLKLRSQVSFENLSKKLAVWAIWNSDYRSPLAFSDPRLKDLGVRLFIEGNTPPPATHSTDFVAYDEYRLDLGIADGSRDMEVGQSTLVESNFDLLNGIDWKKGCYVGQELTARLHYRGLIKKRLFPIRIEGQAPATGTPLSDDCGTMRSHSGAHGLALLKIDAVQKAIDQGKPLTYGESRLWPSIPTWMKIDVHATSR